MPPSRDRAARLPRGSTPAGFRSQLLQRLRDRAAAEGVTADRLQRRVAFERLLTRLASGGPGWLLKGGFSLELRYGWRHRPTKDVDLRAGVPLNAALAQLRAAVAAGHAAQAVDHFSFELGNPGPEMQGAPGGAVRVPVVARVAGVEFTRFHVDLSTGDAVVGAPDLLEGSDLLDFAGILRLRFPSYPVPQQLAEKLHAYTLPRTAANTRTKDFVDPVVLPAVEEVNGASLLASVRATFEARGTHPVPQQFPAPDLAWAQAFRTMMSGIAAAPTTDLDEGFALASRFWNPALGNHVAARRWHPASGAWDPGAV
jgi:hypothetical protein